MADGNSELMIAILKECDSKKGEPWYPGDFVRRTGVDRASLDEPLDQLRMGGLIELTEWVQGKGQGYILTLPGAAILKNPRMLNRLQTQGPPPVTNSPPPRQFQDGGAPGVARAKTIRDALTDPSPPVMTRALLGANLVVFGLGLILASQQSVAGDYLTMFGSENPAAQEIVMQIRYQTGALSIPAEFGSRSSAFRWSYFLESWWRLLTNCFVHHGPIHLLMNMYVLYNFGPIMEKMWGRYRFLFLYLLTGIVGSATAVLIVDSPGNILLAGASGCICGLIGSMLTWVLLNRPYLPREMASSWLGNTMTNIFLIAFISLLPHVSWQGHLGGGVGGALVAIPLTFSRFGEGRQRLFGNIGMLLTPIIIGGVLFYQFSPQSELDWVKHQYNPLIIKAYKVSINAEKNYIRKLRNKLRAGEKISKKEVAKIHKKIDKAQAQLDEIQQTLDNVPTYNDSRVNQALKIAKEYTESLQTYFTTTKNSVDEDGNPVPDEIHRMETNIRRTNDLGEQLRDSILEPQFEMD